MSASWGSHAFPRGRQLSDMEGLELNLGPWRQRKGWGPGSSQAVAAAGAQFGGALWVLQVTEAGRE